ncbi:hypothetical protein IWQ47_000064 [Aquimarina sp. EL_43]|uniref:hypothetical protein n=1 Tax=unclassified Aquimarina TaxID=2627091 RepID=UPI0018CBB684|nr:MULTISPECIES: hypothetical protein [unclassified Aquimarina]MBG6129243.1 hypothetical protein [Aquimarina sp. EL_35]MBG6150308.1 hypothetical protein [Aquimarina sp. EL_32]MBG6167006.1 hypothetical protein [Aquimarina sp. EL_43]
MKKTILKITSILMLTIFIGSCETDDGTIDNLEGESKSLLTENQSEGYLNDNANEAMSQTDPVYFRIISYDNPNGKAYSIIDGKIIVYVGTYITAEAEGPGYWKVTGDFKIIGDPTKRRVRILRTGRKASSIIYMYPVPSGEAGTVLTFVEVPSSVPPTASCPSSGHTMIEQVFNSVLDAKNYDTKYTYKWKIVHNGRTTYKTGRSVLLSKGGSTITLSVSKNGCTTQSSGPKNYFVR